MIKGCPETDDLISDKESGGLTDTTKNLIQKILDERSCGEKSDGTYCCAKKPVAKIYETECEFLSYFLGCSQGVVIRVLQFSSWGCKIGKIYTYLIYQLSGACGKSERSLEMIAGGNGEAIGKVST